MTTRTAFRLALSAILCTAALAAAETTYLPGAAEVTGLAGARFSSTLEVSNPGATGTTVTIGLVPMAGKPAPVPVMRTLMAGESLRISEALKTLFGLTDGAAGTLTVTSDEPLLANLSTRNVAAPEGAYGLGLLPVPWSDLLGAGETGHSIWVSQSADPSTGYRTNLSVTLAEPGTVVEVRIFDAEGRVAGTVTVTAATPEVWQQPATSLIGAGTSLPVGRAEFQVKAGRATAFAVVNDNVTSDAIALQTERVVPGLADRLISGAALAPGHLGSFWSTDLRLFNPGSVALDATIQSVGATRAASVVVPVPAKGVVEVARVLALLGFPEGTACALRVRATDALLVAARTNNVDPAGVRKGTFSAQQFVTSWASGLLGAGVVGFFNGIDQTLNVPGVRTNLTIVGGPEGAAGELVLRDAAGIERGRAGFLRGPGEWGQRGVADWFATAPAVPENARIDVSVASGALDAFVSRIDNGSGDAVTRPVALPAGGDCSKVAVTSLGAAPQPVNQGVSTTFSWTVAIDPPTAELTSQSIRFDGEPEIELGKELRSYKRSFTSSGARSVTLTVRKGSCVKTRSLSFFVCGDLSLEPATLPDGVAFANYPTRTLTVPGATAPTTFSVATGALPEGLVLSPAGQLSGQAEEAGFFPFTAKAVDANGCTGTREYTIRIFCPTLRIAPSTLPAGTVAASYPVVGLTVTGGSGSGSWSATGLPPGLVLSTAGQLSGTPTAAGTYAVAVRFSDSSGCEGTASYTILVCNTLVVSPGTVPAGTAGALYGPVGFTAAGATGAATWTVTSGSLPAGVTLSAAGVLSGTPTVVGTFPVTITATDSLGCTGSVAVSLVVNCPVITVNPAALVAAFEDAPYNAVLTQTGGSAGSTFSVVTGALPAGLTLNPATGVLSGTVAVPGNTSFTVRATDPVTSCFGDRPYSFTVTPVNDAPSFVKGPDVAVLEDSGPHTAGWATAISAGPADESGQVLTFNVTGNTNPTLFSAAPTVTPAGVLGFTPAPNASGTATITLTLSDNGGTANGGVDTSAAQTFVITVTDVNDVPSFTKGPDVTVNEDAPAYSAAWATALSAGPASESGQTLTFNVTGNTNAALFSAVPAVSPAGVLSFTPAANANGTATITLTLSDNGGTASGGVDTSPSQTFVVNVTAVNDAPSFAKGADQTVLEESGAQTVNPWATAISPGPSDESAQTVSFAITGNTNASLFAAAPAVSPEGVLTFTPAANASGSASITLTISDTGGTANGGVNVSAAQTFVINVTDVNDAPSFTKGPDQTVLEDAGAQTVNPWATAISAGPPSEAGQTVTFNVTGNTNPGLFSVAPAVSPTGVLTYTPAANANGTATITLTISDNGGTANGGANVSAVQTFVINVTAVNDAPSFAKGADQTVFDNAGAQTVNPWATAISKGPADEAGQTVTFSVTGNTNPALFAVVPAIDASGVLTYTPNPSSGGTATITITLSDDGGTANGGVNVSAAQTFTITFNHVNAAPSFTKGPDQTLNEDAGAQTVPGWATAISPGPPVEAGQTLTFNVTNNTNPGLFTVGPAVSPTGVLTYTTAANANGTATITITLSDNGGTANGGVDTSAPQSFVITVNAVNDAPSFTKGTDPTVNEDSGAFSAAWATAISPGPADESGQTLTFNVTGNTNAALFSAAPAISATGVLTFTPAANAFGSATITITLSDSAGTANGGVNVSAAQTFVINVNAVNDAPSFTKGADQNVNDNAGAVTVNPWAAGISVGPANEAGQTLTFQITGNSDPSIFAAGPSVSSTGVLTYTPATVPAGTHSSTITIRLQDNGGTANGGVDTSATQTFTVSITHVNVAPTLTTNPITYSTPGNTQLHVAGATLPGVVSVSDASSALAKSVPTDPDGPSAPSVVPASGSSVNGGSYSIAADGSFTFVPAAGFTGTDTFTFQVTDQNPGTPGIAVGTVSVSVGQRVWYVRDVVDANNAAGGDGRSTNAFDSIAAFNGATTNDGDVVFVFRGNTGTTALSGGFTLRNGQKLWGEGIGLTISGFGTLVAAGSQPRINNGSGDAVSVPATAGNRQNVEIRGLDLTGSVNAVDVTASGANLVGVTISNNTVSGAGVEGIDLNAGSTGAFTATVSSNAITATGNGIDARTSAATALSLDTSNNTVTSGANGILVDGSGGGTTTVTGFANNAISGNTVGTGISVTSATFDQTPGSTFQTVPGGTTTVGSGINGVGASGVVLTSVSGDLAFTDLDIIADSGTGLRASGTTPYTGSAGFQLTVGAGVATIVAAGGPAVSLTTVRANLPFQQITSTTSPTTGVALNSLLGTFSAGSGSSIASATGTSFQVGSSNATISYAGTINATTGKGVDLTSNTGSTISFTGTLTLSTGTNTAFNATGGGTVTATDTASTLTTTTGTALNVANTTIGASGLKFRSISANGGANGIVLDTTGSSGGLTVSGTGSAGSGGTIRNMVGADDAVAGNGLYLNSTSTVSLSWMQLNDFQNFAIRGIGVTGFTLANSVINGVNGNNAAVNEGSVSFSDLTGSASVTSTNISGGLEDNFRLVNTAGILNRITFSSVTIGPNSTALGNDGILLEAQAGATVNATIQNSTFTSARGDLFQFNHIGSAACDLVFTGNTLTNNHPAIATGGGGVTIGGSGTGNLTYSISGNSFRDSDGHAVLLVKSTSTASYTGSFSNNTVGVAGINDSGSKTGSGLKVQNAGGGIMQISATNNQIRQYNNFGIELVTGGSATPQGGQLNATVTGNTISNPGTGGLPMNGIQLNGGTVVGDTYSICTSIGGVGASANSVAGSGANGGTDIRVRQRMATTVRLPGYGGANNDNTAVQNFIAANNGGATLLASNNVPTGGGFVGGAPCP